MGPSWTRPELAELKRTYASTPTAQLAEGFGRTVEDVEAMASTLALAKSKRAFRGEREMPRWSVEELDFLRRYYPDYPNVEIARELRRSTKSVTSKASLLGLRKSERRLARMGCENVALRRDRTAGLAELG